MNSAARFRRLAGATIALAICAPLAFGATPERRLADRLTPLDYRGEDGPVAMAVDAGGTRWSAWSYRRGLEADIAVARQFGSVWSGAELLDPGNGLLDDQPAIAFLADGRPVVAWRQRADGAPGRIVYSLLDGGRWTDPAPVTPATIDASSPHLLRTGGSLVLVYVADGRAICTRVLFPEAQGLSDLGGNSASGGIVIEGEGGSRFENDEDEPDSGSNGPDPMPTRSIPPPDAGGYSTGNGDGPPVDFGK